MVECVRTRECMCVCVLDCVISKHVYPVRNNHSDFIVQQRGSIFGAIAILFFVYQETWRKFRERKEKSDRYGSCTANEKFENTREMSIAGA